METSGLKSALLDADPQDVAAMHFTMYLPRFESMVNSMSAKQLKKLIIGLATVPIINDKFTGVTQLEKDAFYLGEDLLTTKHVMVLSALMQGGVFDNQPETEGNENGEEKTN